MRYELVRYKCDIKLGPCCFLIDAVQVILRQMDLPCRFFLNRFIINIVCILICLEIIYMCEYCFCGEILTSSL